MNKHEKINYVEFLARDKEEKVHEQTGFVIIRLQLPAKKSLPEG